MTRLIAALLLALPSLGAAQVISVAGEDPGSAAGGVAAGPAAAASSLEIRFPAGLGWRFDRVRGGFRLAFEIGDLLLHGAERIGRDPAGRIEGVRLDPAGGAVLIDSGCDCPAEIRLAAPGHLVLRITDSEVVATLSNARFAQGTTGGGGPKDGLPDMLPGLLARSEPPEVRGSLSDGPAAAGRGRDTVRHPPEDGGEPRHENSVGGLAATASEEASNRLMRTRELVLKELTRAASQGLLEVNPDLAMGAPDTAAKPRGGGTARALDLGEIGAFLDALPNARAETSIDRGLRGTATPGPLTANGSRCLTDRDLDIGAWTGDGTIYNQISQYRLHLVEEFDRENREAAIGLARSYIYLTFGAEARNVLDVLGVTGADADILRTMAQIVDLGHDGAPGPFAGQQTCPTAAAFWAAMALPDFGRGMPIDRKAVLRTFSGLPLHLRRHLGPPLALRFLDIGDRDTSYAIRDAIDRAAGDHGQGFELLRANIDRDLGHDQAASARYDRIAAQDGALAPTALIERVDLAIEHHGDLPEGVVESVAALAFEYRGTPEGADLARAYVLANIVENRFDEALSSLLRIETGDASEKDVFPELWSQLALGMARTADDVVFLSAYYKHRQTLAERQVSRVARERLAERLVGLGFGADAVTELGFYPSGGTPGADLLLARAEIEAGATERARTLLTELPGDAPRRLLADIATRDRDYKTAAAIYAGLKDAEARADADWRAGNWQDVAALTKGPRQAAAELMTAEDPMALSQAGPAAPADAKGPIAENEVRLAHSAWVRKTLGALIGPP